MRFLDVSIYNLQLTETATEYVLIFTVCTHYAIEIQYAYEI